MASLSKKTIKYSVYTKLWMRASIPGFVFLMALLDFAKFVPENTTDIVISIMFLLLIAEAISMIFVRFEAETEDEMVQKLYAKADSIADTVNMWGFLIIAVFVSGKSEIVKTLALSSEIVVIMMTGLLFFVQLTRIAVVFYHRRKGIYG